MGRPAPARVADATAGLAEDEASAGADAGSATAVGLWPAWGLLRLALLRRRRRLLCRAATLLPLLGMATLPALRRRRAFVSATCSQYVNGNGGSSVWPLA